MGRTTPRKPRPNPNADLASQRPSTKVVILAVLAVFAMILPLIATLATATSTPKVRCEITPNGFAYRTDAATMGYVIAEDQRRDGEVGDRYSSETGCVPGDNPV